MNTSQYHNTGYVKRRKDHPVIHSAYGDTISSSKGRVVHQKLGDYAATLVDPWTHRNVRIPDLASYPTSPYTCEYEFLWSPGVVNSAASTSALIVDINSNPQFSFLNGMEAAATMGTNRTVTTALSSTITSRYTMGRVVSAGICVKFAGNDSNSAGMLYGVNRASGLAGPGVNYNNTSTAAPEVTNPTQQQTYYAGPLREGVILTYRPLDADSFAMQSTAGTGVYGQFIICMNGLPMSPSAPSFNVHIVVNCEGIIINNTLGLEQGGACVMPASYHFGLQAAIECPSTSGATETDAREMAKTAMELEGAGKGGLGPRTSSESEFITPARPKKSKYFK